MNFEAVEAHVLAGIGLIRGIGELALSEFSHRFIVPRGLLKVDMEAINNLIAEVGKEYGE